MPVDKVLNEERRSRFSRRFGRREQKAGSYQPLTVSHLVCKY